MSSGIRSSYTRLTWPSQRKPLWDSRANRLGIPAFAKTSLLGMRSCQVMPWIFPRQRTWNVLSLALAGCTGSKVHCHKAECWARRLYKRQSWFSWSAKRCHTPIWLGEPSLLLPCRVSYLVLCPDRGCWIWWIRCTWILPLSPRFSRLFECCGHCGRLVLRRLSSWDLLWDQTICRHEQRSS